jgi:hypothetical protein
MRAITRVDVRRSKNINIICSASKFAIIAQQNYSVLGGVCDNSYLINLVLEHGNFPAAYPNDIFYGINGSNVFWNFCANYYNNLPYSSLNSALCPIGGMGPVSLNAANILSHRYQ